MKKNIVTIVAVLFVLNLSAQFSVSETNAVDYPLKKKPTSQYFHFTDRDYFLLTYPDVVNPGYNLFVVDNAGLLKDKSEIEYDKGVFNNSKIVHSFHQLGNKMIAALECRNKGEGKNRLVVRTLSGDGNLKSDDKEIGSMDYEKMGNPGDWFVYSTADKQHLAVISINPTEKEQKEIINAFRKSFLPALDKENFNDLWVAHRDKGRLELHFVVVAAAEGAKATQPFVDTIKFV